MLLRSNPLLGLSVSQAQALYDAARVAHGSSPLLQRVYAEIESIDPVLLTCVERRAAALSGMGWSVEIDGDDGTQAQEQRRVAEDLFAGIENLDEAIEHLGLCFFRGYSFAQPVWEGDSVRRITPLQSWNVIWADGEWFWNPDCNPTAEGLDPIGEDVLRVTCSRAIDYPALFIYLRHNLAERDWGRYVERYGIPPVDAIMAETAAEQDRPAYEQAADAARDGVSVVWPAGTSVTRADSSRGSDPFSAIIEHQEKLLVLMATGGTLTSLAQADTGTLAGGAQMDVWRQIVARIATVVAGAIHRGLLLPLLERRFPGQTALVRFSLGKSAAPSPQELLDMAAKAKTAGYTLDQSDLERGTGLKFEKDPTGTPGMGAAGFFGGGIVQNDAGDAPADENSKTDEALHAMSEDFEPIRTAVRDLLASEGEAEARTKAADLLEHMPGMIPPTPALAAVVEATIADGVADGIVASRSARTGSPAPAAGDAPLPDPSLVVAKPLQNARSVSHGENPIPEAGRAQNAAFAAGAGKRG